MRRNAFTTVQKVAAGYLAIVLFTLVALGYALTSLHSQTARSEQVVSVDFKALNLMEDLRRNLLAQETLEKQLVILRDRSLLDLLDRRRDDNNNFWREFSALPLVYKRQILTPLMQSYRKLNDKGRTLLHQGKWHTADRFLAKKVAPLRNHMVGILSELAADQEKTINASLSKLTKDSLQAYRITSLLALIGILLSAPAAFTVIFSIHHSVRALTRATQEIAAGSFDYEIGIQGRDEFGKLAQAFAEMGRKLHEMEQLCLDANPLTHLPGNRTIDREIEARMAHGRCFSHLYIDLDHFKAFGDRYGYGAGSKVLALVGEIVSQATQTHGNADDLVGHIGGDDYLVLTTPERAEAIAKTLIDEFDRIVPSFYSEEDLALGYFVGKDRFGIERKFPLLTISVAIINSENLESPSAFAISRKCAMMKDHLKKLPGSNYMVDRRKNI